MLAKTRCNGIKLYRNTLRFNKFQQRTFSKGVYASYNYGQELTKRAQHKNRIIDTDPYSFWVIGSGPAGFYTAKSILNNSEKIKVDIIDSQPHPFGLIRNGIAPDHQAMKNIMHDYDSVLSHENCQFYGNITVGEDVSISE